MIEHPLQEETARPGRPDAHPSAQHPSRAGSVTFALVVHRLPVSIDAGFSPLALALLLALPLFFLFGIAAFVLLELLFHGLGQGVADLLAGHDRSVRNERIGFDAEVLGIFLPID